MVTDGAVRPVLQIAMPRSPRIYVASFGSLLRLPRPFTDSETAAAIFGKGDIGPALLKTTYMPLENDVHELM